MLFYLRFIDWGREWFSSTDWSGSPRKGDVTQNYEIHILIWFAEIFNLLHSHSSITFKWNIIIEERCNLFNRIETNSNHATDLPFLFICPSVFTEDLCDRCYPKNENHNFEIISEIKLIQCIQSSVYGNHTGTSSLRSLSLFPPTFPSCSLFPISGCINRKIAIHICYVMQKSVYGKTQH